MSHDYTPNLIKMANQIAVNQPVDVLGEEAAVEAVSSHMQKFWDPRMKEKICAYVDQDGSELNVVAKAAVVRLKTAN